MKLELNASGAVKLTLVPETAEEAAQILQLRNELLAEGVEATLWEATETPAGRPITMGVTHLDWRQAWGQR